MISTTRSEPPREDEPSVLIVDDVHAMVDALAALLRTRLPQCRVQTSTSAAAALERVRKAPFDVMITDVVMPGVDGITLLERARALRPELLVVIVSGVEAGEVTRRALRAGAYDFIVKPVDGEHLEVVVRRALETQRLRREVEQQQESLRRHAEELERAVEERTKELSQSNRSKDELLAMLSHELRTPLTAILGWARLLERPHLDEATRAQAIQAIARNATSQGQLVMDLLDVSSMVAGRLQLRKQRVRLRDVIEAAYEDTVEAAQAAGVSLEKNLASDLGTVIGDPDRLKQMVWNLLHNALKFTDSGGAVKITAARCSDEVEIAVADTGAGIDPAFLPHVFERFRQGQGALDAARSGLGLGLSITSHLAELHGGAVSAESRGRGKGATFRIKLPATPLSQGRGSLAELGR